jgi:hypothetical protein
MEIVNHLHQNAGVDNKYLIKILNLLFYLKSQEFSISTH